MVILLLRFLFRKYNFYKELSVSQQILYNFIIAILEPRVWWWTGLTPQSRDHSKPNLNTYIKVKLPSETEASHDTKFYKRHVRMVKWNMRWFDVWIKQVKSTRIRNNSSTTDYNSLYGCYIESFLKDLIYSDFFSEPFIQI